MTEVIIQINKDDEAYASIRCEFEGDQLPDNLIAFLDEHFGERPSPRHEEKR